MTTTHVEHRDRTHVHWQGRGRVASTRDDRTDRHDGHRHAALDGQWDEQ